MKISLKHLGKENIMKKNILIIILCLSFIISGCASTAAEITPKYITPHTYQNLDCNQISTEMLRVSNQVTELTGQQNKIHKNDQMMGWVGSFFYGHYICSLREMLQ